MIPIGNMWAARGACIGKTEIMFDEDGRDRAKAICARCPVKNQCLQFALDSDILEGVWGGRDFEERTKICPICGKAKAPDALGCNGAHTLERLARLIEQQQAGDIGVSVSIRSTPTAPTSPGCIQLRGKSHSSARAYKQGCRCAPALAALTKERAARPPAIQGRPPMSQMQRFMGLVEIDGDHWRWTGSTNGSGYGNFWNGVTNVRAHLFAYRAFKGPMAEGARLKPTDESRGERPCVNPDHFELVGRVA